MANSINRSDAGAEVSPILAGIGGAHGGSVNYIVGQYYDDGHRTRRGANASGADLEAAKRMERVMQRYGERISTFTVPAPQPMIQVPQPVMEKKASKGKRGKKTAEPMPAIMSQPVVAQPVEPNPYYVAPAPVPQPVRNMTVVFSTGLGKIRVTVEGILEIEDGIALVFANDGEVRFVPEKGNELTLGLPDGREVKVFYLGLLFTWFNSPQQVMTFYKT